MAHKLIHRQLPHEVRFPNRPTAEQYADHFGGGLANWVIAVAGARRSESNSGHQPSGR